MSRGRGGKPSSLTISLSHRSMLSNWFCESQRRDAALSGKGCRPASARSEQPCSCWGDVPQLPPGSRLQESCCLHAIERRVCSLLRDIHSHEPYPVDVSTGMNKSAARGVHSAINNAPRRLSSYSLRALGFCGLRRTSSAVSRPGSLGRDRKVPSFNAMAASPRRSPVETAPKQNEAAHYAKATLCQTSSVR